MNLYMSAPFANTILSNVNDLSNKEGQSELYQCYLNVFYKIFGAYCLKEFDKNVLDVPLTTAYTDREEFISISLRPLLKEFDLLGRQPEILFDCYSFAPVGGPAHTYKLAILNKLPRIMPIALNGQAGTEILQAIQFIKGFKDKITDGVIVTASQLVTWPDSRVSSKSYRFSDASASVIISPSIYPRFTKFEVLKTYLFQFSSEASYEYINSQIQLHFVQSRIKRDSVHWSIFHNYNNDYKNIMSSMFPNATTLNRSEDNLENFGCADPLVTLHNIYENKISSLQGVGIIWFVGRYNSIGYLLVRSL